MKKMLMLSCMLAFNFCIQAQCFKASGAENEELNGNYTLSEGENFHGYPVYVHSNEKYFLHKDEDNWYVNMDRDSPDEQPLLFCAEITDTPPLTGWKTMDESTPPTFTTKCE